LNVLSGHVRDDLALNLHAGQIGAIDLSLSVDSGPVLLLINGRAVLFTVIYSS
jgi:hypothetical protein